jgi:uncharacterized iron-regulated protein
MGRWLLLLLVSGVITACSQLPGLPEWQSPQGRDNPQLGQIIELASGRQLTPAQLAARLGSVDRVLIGEQHDNPDHHALELWLLRALGQRRMQGSLLLEMLVPAQQARVDRAKRASTVEGLPDALGWQQGWDWAGYGPIVRFAFSQPFPLLAANLDPGEVRAIFAAPQLPGGSHTAAPQVRQVLLEQIRESHCDMLPEAHLPAMLAVQQQRDRRMALSLLAAPTPAMLIAGSYHARKDVGVPLHLLDEHGTGSTKVLLLAAVGSQVTAQMADYVWFSPATAPVDYCAQLRKVR